MRQVDEAGHTSLCSGQENYESDNAHSCMWRAVKPPIVPLVSHHAKLAGGVAGTTEELQLSGCNREKGRLLFIFLTLISLLNAVLWLGLVWVLGLALAAMQSAGLTSWRVVESDPLTILILGGGIWGGTLAVLYAFTAGGSSEG